MVKWLWTAVLLRGFLGGLRRSLGLGRLAFSQHRRAIVHRARPLVRVDEASWAVDKASYVHLCVAAHMVVTYEYLQTLLPDEASRIEALKHAAVAMFEWPMRRPVRLALRWVDPWRAVDRLVNVPLMVAAFGGKFAFERLTPAPDHVLLRISACLYHQYFVQHGVPQLTPVMCHSDHAWIDEIDPVHHALDFERPTTIGRGGATCDFNFRRTTPRGK